MTTLYYLSKVLLQISLMFNVFKKHHYYFYVCNKMKRPNYTNSLNKKILFIRPKMGISCININDLIDNDSIGGVRAAIL